MTQPTLVIFPRGQLTSKDKERLTKAGIIAVEADDPKAVCQLQLTEPMVNTKINGDGLVRAAIGALAAVSSADGYGKYGEGGKAKAKFVELIFESLKSATGSAT